MAPEIFSHSVAPAEVLRGEGAWIKAIPRISQITKRPLFIGRTSLTFSLREKIAADLISFGIKPIMKQLQHDCCKEDIQRIINEAPNCDAVFASGGGKVLDAGKLLASQLELPCITVPLSAATCAGWTALSNVYSREGYFKHDVVLERCPELLVFDHNFIRNAPKRTLASGIADALAKWYEASISSGDSSDGLVQQAVQLARVLRDQLLIDGPLAMQDINSDSWVRTVEACALTAGLIGGLGGPRCRTVAAHAVHNGLTQLPSCHHMLHGEKVGFGILVQLRLEERLGGNRLAGQSQRQLLPFFRELGLPVSLNDLGLGNVTLSELKQVCSFACREGSDIYHLPFEISSSVLLESLIGIDELAVVHGF